MEEAITMLWAPIIVKDILIQFINLLALGIELSFILGRFLNFLTFTVPWVSLILILYDFHLIVPYICFKQLFLIIGWNWIATLRVSFTNVVEKCESSLLCGLKMELPKKKKEQQLWEPISSSLHCRASCWFWPLKMTPKSELEELRLLLLLLLLFSWRPILVVKLGEKDL